MMAVIAATMNYMTWDRVVCFFPLATFHDKRAYRTEGTSDLDGETQMICKIAGLEVFEAGEPPDTHNIPQGTFTAHLGSNHTWDMELKVDGKPNGHDTDSILKISALFTSGVRLQYAVNSVTSMPFRYDVLDWTTQVTLPGGYLRCTDAFEWR